MNTAFYTGVSGMIAFQKHMDTTAHNMANVSTAGYKAGRSSFSDLIYTQMDVNTPGEKLVGHGAKNDITDLVMGQSSLSMTGRPLDFAIVGENCFFALEMADGGIKYSRNGAFQISIEGRKGFLVSGLDGSYVLDDRERRIELPVDETGTGFDFTGLEEKIGIFTFDNPYALAREDGSSFTETDNSGRARRVVNNTDNPSYELRGSTLENSGVQLTDEMVNIIQAQRAFQMNSTIVRTADEMEEMINNLR